MNASKSHVMSLIWASLLLAFFAIAATIVIVTWSPILPEAIAVSMNNDANDFASYIALHETESWQYTGALNPESIADCPR